MNMSHNASCVLVLVLTTHLYACSSSEIPIFDDGGSADYIPPINGAWRASDGEIIDFDDEQPNVAGLRTNSDTLTLQSLNTVTLCPEYLEQGEQNISLLADFNNQRVSFRLNSDNPANPVDVACGVGEFTNQITLRVESNDGNIEKVFNNSRVDVTLNDGYWVSSSGLELLFAFPSSVDNDSTANLEGCILSGDSARTFVGQLDGFNTLNSTPVKADTLIDNVTGVTYFTNMQYIHKNRISLINDAGVIIELARTELNQQLQNTPDPCDI